MVYISVLEVNQRSDIMASGSLKMNKEKLSRIFTVIAILLPTIRINNMIMGEWILRSFGLDFLFHKFNSFTVTLICSIIIFIMAIKFDEDSSLKITKGKLSIMLTIIAILFSLARINNVIMGEQILRSIGLSFLFNSFNSYIVTLSCSMIIFAFAVFLAVKSKEDFTKISGGKLVIFTVVIVGVVLSNIYR